jgi:RimJ/RimL family protein N-acetyltransferase
MPGPEGPRPDLRFEPLVARHAAALGPILADGEALRFTRLPEPVPPGFAATWIASYAEGRRTGEKDGFAVLTAAGSFAGLALAPAIDRAGREVELGYIVDPAARGRGVATQALGWLTRWAFEDLGALRAALIINAGNEPSRRVARRCGYLREGLMRSVHLKGSVRVDAELWSRLPTDPPVEGLRCPEAG